MLTGWLPFDFPKQESPDTIAYTGTEAVDLMGVTHHVMSIDTMNCAVDTSWTGAGPSDTTEVEGLYAAHPIAVPDSCPCAHGHHGPTTKRDGNTLLETCVTPRYYPGGEYYIGVLDYTVDSASSLRFISPITDAKLQLHITQIEGECVTLSVEIPQFGFTKIYSLNCGDVAPLGGGGARTKRDDDRSLLSDTLSDPTYALIVNLASIKDSLAALVLGQHLKIYLHVTTAADGVTFVDGSQGEDTRPKLLLTGTYHRISDGADYTVAYQHDDSALSTTVTAKIDDSLHTVNSYDPTYTLGAKIRRAQAKHLFGADYRLNKTLIPMIGDATNAARVDTVDQVYTGNGARLMTKNSMRDSVQMRYDVSGRPDSIINADGTMSFVTYRTGTPASFGITGQEFYGFCAAKTMTNEDGVKHTTYTDAFDHVRREIADTNGLHLMTRFDYDSLGQLTRVINPKGDSTLYLYDDLGRIAIKVQADIGGISYAYDHLGNVRFTQNQEQYWKGRMTFTEYDDMNRPTLIGEAILCDRYGDPDYENDGPEDGWLWGHIFDGSGHTIGSRARQGKERDRTVMGEGSGGGDGGGISIDPCSGINRMTELIDGSKLHTGDTTRDTLVTANPTVWNTALSAVPTFWPYSKLAKKTCTLTAIEPLLNETQAPVTPLLMHPVQNYASPAGPRATI
ncbi:MAG: RHS repeat domain-containing protein, partial [Bacteroidota bacterium]